jgi:hypothetical protein
VVECRRKGDNQEQFYHVLSLSSYHPHANLIEMLWAVLKDLITECRGRNIQLFKQGGMAA